jgi:septum formation protein
LKARLGTEAPDGIARKLAAAKAEAVSRRRPDALVIGADQVLAFEGEILNKPGEISAARTQLQQLRGKTHHQHSGVALAQGGKILWSHCEQATLTMRRFSDAFLDRYLAEAGTSLCGIVGAYEIEGRGIQLFERVEGDHFTIIGLPLLPLLAELRSRGALPA